MTSPARLFCGLALGAWLAASLAGGGCGGSGVPAVAAGQFGTGGAGGSASSSSSSGGSSGDAGACTPGATSACYSGPPGTEGVGTCKAGTQTCAANGSGFGPCAGEVTPQPEDCTTAANEDCSGSNAACGKLGWAGRFGAKLPQEGRAIDVDVAGDVAVTGVFQGTLDFGAGPLDAGTDQDLFVAKLGPSGAPLWSRQWSTKDAFGHVGGVAFDPGGNVLFAGTSTDTIDFGGGPRCVMGFDQTFLVKLDAQGNHLWSRCFGDGMETTGNYARVAVDPAGNAVLAATIYGPIDFGTGPLSSGSVVVASYDPAGNTRWAVALGEPESADAIAFGLAVGPTGNVVVGGSFFGTVDLGTGPFTSGQERDAFVVALDPAGNPLWSRALGGAGDQSADSIAVDAQGHVVVTGAPFQTIDLGGGQVVTQPGPAPIVAAFDASGHPLWSWGTGPGTAGSAVACGNGNDVFALVATPGPDPDAGPAGTNGFSLARLDPTGTLLSSHAFGSGTGTGLAAKGPWLALIATAVGPVDLGGGPLIGSGDEDVLIALIAQ